MATKLAAGQLDRRSFLRAGAAVGASSLLLSPGRAFADVPSQIVVSNFGGAAVKCQTESYGNSFTEATGVPVVMDGAGPLEGKILKMVDSGQVVWDLCDVDYFNALRLGKKGKLEKIDYSIVDKSTYMEPFAGEYGVLNSWYAYVLAWDTEKLGTTAPTWADFFDVEKIPGKRTLYRHMIGVPEVALLGDGVPQDQVYPLDMERALDKIASIKDHIVFWNSGSESQQMLFDKEVVMGGIWTTRAQVVKRDTGGRVDWTFDNGIALPAGWAIPKGNPAGAEWANRFLAHVSDPVRQIVELACLGRSPANPKAYDIMPEEHRKIAAGAPENLSRMLPLNSEYYAEHYDDMLNSYIDMISS
jgi:putative spermidine/putrescine transport system substrate-binding protein